MKKLIIYFFTLYFFTSCMIDKPIETIYIQPESLENLDSGFFTIGTSSQLYKLSPFSIGKYEVTFDEWRTTYDWAIKNGYIFANTGTCGTTSIKTGSYTKEQGTLPVIRISWGDAIVWCNARSEQEGLNPVYTFEDGSILRNSKIQDDDYNFLFRKANFNHNRNGYRLPTKFEWQFAAQGGASEATVFSGTDSELELEDYAWVYSNANGVIQNVGKKKPNSLGLYDMSGNADEWLWVEEQGSPADVPTKVKINGVEKSVYIDPKGSGLSYKIVMGGNVNCGNTSSKDKGEQTIDSCKVLYTQRGALPSLYETFGGFRICRTTGEN